MAILQNLPVNHSEVIREYLELILQTPTSEVKAIHTKTLYDYLRVEGFDYVMRNRYFKATTIKKAYELKRESDDFVELHNSLNCYLVAFGAPLVEEEGEEDDEEEEDEL